MSSMPIASTNYWSPKRIAFSVSGPESRHPGDVSVDRPYATLGSSKNCDVVLNAKRVPRLAMLFVVTNRGLRVLMLSSHSKRSGECLRVDPNQPIRLGEFEISVRIEGDEDVAADRKEPANETSIFVATWRSGEHRRFLKLSNESPITVGRKAPAHLRLKDDRVSGQHCALFRSGSTLWVMDLHSANGTVVSSESIQCVPLDIGQSLLAGQHRIHFTRLHTDEEIGELKSDLQNQTAHLQSELTTLSSREAQAIDALSQAHAAERSASSRLEQSQLVTQKVEAESQDLRSEIADLHDRLSQATAERDDAINRHEAANHEASTLRSQLAELNARAETLEHDLSETKELLNDKESLRKREVQLDSLQRELSLERQILHELQLGVAPNPEDGNNANAADEEHVISTFDFQDVLEEALESLPSIEEDN